MQSGCNENQCTSHPDSRPTRWDEVRYAGTGECDEALRYANKPYRPRTIVRHEYAALEVGSSVNLTPKVTAMGRWSSSTAQLQEPAPSRLRRCGVNWLSPAGGEG